MVFKYEAARLNLRNGLALGRLTFQNKLRDFISRNGLAENWLALKP